MKIIPGYVVRGVILFIFFTFNYEIFPQNLTKEYKTSVVENISKLLADRYVFPEVAEKCGEHIKTKLESGTFDTITTKEQFAAVLTKELQSISKDKHMRVRPDNRPPQETNQDPFYQEFLFKSQNNEENIGFAKVEFLEGGIGYLDLRFFAPLVIAKNHAEAAMSLLANSDALIIDLRKNRGGNPDLIRFISSYFFDKPTHLNSLYYREGNRTEEFWTSKIENSTLTGVPIFVLTSSFTFSGGEEFTNNLKTRKRATVIGETTGGGANPGGMFRIDENLAIFIPTGKAINPVTNSNWEGTGVEPDIKVSSDEAYNVALEKAKTAAEDYREERREKALTAFKNISNKLNEAEKILSSDRRSAEGMIRDALDKGINTGLVDENSVNMAGYNYLAENKFDMAIAIFTYNVKRFPESFNVYDSLGEAYMKNNQFDLATNYYKKSLELNPENKNAEEMIKKMSK